MNQRVAASVQTKLFVLATAILMLIVTWVFFSHPAAGIAYGSGTYGSCTYDVCGISLSSSGSISASVTPAAGSTRCTVNNDIVTVTTHASTGYTVTLKNTDTSGTLNGTGSTIAAHTGTSASPSVLTANTWGYRVDSVASFGAGPTSAVSNAAVPAQTFAGVPLSSGTAAIIRTTNVVDTGAVNTSVWYGVCADSSLKSGSYSDSVTYTAVIN